MTEGPQFDGIISARRDNRLQVTSVDGTKTVVGLSLGTKIKSSSGIFGGRSNLAADSLLNGLPVSVKTVQWGGGLVASQIKFKKGDFKTASMIRTGTEQQFGEQAAATEALRGRMADIDKYNVKSTLNVNFDVDKAVLSDQAKAELCNTASQAQATENALMLVVGYTDFDRPRGIQPDPQRTAGQPRRQLPSAGVRLEALSHADADRHVRIGSAGG